MNRKENNGGLIIRDKGSVWIIKVGVWAPLSESSRIYQKTKRWEIKLLLN